jgi:hypothetical protein
MDDEQELGPPKTIRCACGHEATLREIRGEAGSFGGRVRLGAIGWFYECPAGHRESLDDALQRLDREAGLDG